MTATNTKDRSDKRLMRACAKYILGESTGVKITGSQERISAFQDVLLSSRALFEALGRRAPLSEVNDLIQKKSSAAERFKRTVGIVWPL